MSEEITETFEEAVAGWKQNPEVRKATRRLKPFYDLVLQIIRRRNELGLTQKALAERANTFQSRVSKIESAEHDIRLSTLVEIAEALETEVIIQLKPLPAGLSTNGDDADKDHYAG